MSIVLHCAMQASIWWTHLCIGKSLALPDSGEDGRSGQERAPVFNGLDLLKSARRFVIRARKHIGRIL